MNALKEVMSHSRGRRVITKLATAACMLCLLGLGQQASGAPMTFDFGGHLDPGGNFPGLAAGTPFTGSFTWDTVQADANPLHPQIGLYGISSMTLTIEGETATVAPVSQSVLIGNNIGGDFVTITAELPEISGTLGGLGLSRIQIDLLNCSGLLFGDDSLPTSLDRDDFTTAFVTITDPAGGERTGSITTMHAPEPNALAALASLSIFGVGVRTYRRRRKA